MKKILLVGDRKPHVDEGRGILARSDFQIFKADTKEQALHTANKMDLIIIDMEMPELPGDELCTAIRQEAGLKKTAILMVCSRKKADIERCAKSGASSYITKPVNRGEFHNIVCRLLDIPQRRGIRVLINISVKGLFETRPFFCVSQNLSRSGILFETTRVLAKGDVIECSFFLPEEERITARGEVVRVLKPEPHIYAYGVTFLNLGAEEEAAIHGYIEKKSQEPDAVI